MNTPASPSRTAADLIRHAQNRLHASASARLDAELLLRHALGVDRVHLFMRLQEPVSSDIANTYEALVQRRMQGEPVAYITGVREFMNLEFSVTPDTLVPRPETEILVEWALNWAKQHPGNTVVDVGTGSGAIAISMLADDLSDLKVIASDVSSEALEIAASNATHLLHPEARPKIRFVQGNLLNWLDHPVAMVLANLPYLTPNQMLENPDLAFEPSSALYGGRDGLDLVRQLVDDLPRVLTGNAFAAGFELDPSQTAVVRDLLARQFPNAKVSIISDLAGHERHVVMVQETQKPRLA